MGVRRSLIWALVERTCFMSGGGSGSRKADFFRTNCIPRTFLVLYMTISLIANNDSADGRTKLYTAIALHSRANQSEAR